MENADMEYADMENADMENAGMEKRGHVWILNLPAGIPAISSMELCHKLHPLSGQVSEDNYPTSIYLPYMM